MENTHQQPQGKSTWTSPDITVAPVSEITLGLGAAGTDFGSEISGV